MDESPEPQHLPTDNPAGAAEPPPQREKRRLRVVIVVVLLVVAGASAAFAAWELLGDDDDGENDARSAVLDQVRQAPATDCDGDWYDTHVHLDQNGYTADVIAQMDVHKIGCALVFAHFDENQASDSYLELRRDIGFAPGRFVPFFDVIGTDINDGSRANVEPILNQYKGTVIGLGEQAFYRQPFQGTSLTATPWPDLFALAEEKDIWLMIHPTEQVVGDLETMLNRYPKAKVLVHGFELPEQLPQLLNDHDNLYFTLDTTTLTTLLGDGPVGAHVLFYPDGEGNAQAFVQSFDTNKTTLLDQAKAKWLPVVLAAPERVMWGTDASFDWHVDGEVYKRIMALSDEFVAMIPTEYRSAYKRDNALRLLGPGVKAQPLTEEEKKQLDGLDDGGRDDEPD